MSEQGGALADVRAALIEYEYAVASHYWGDSDDWRGTDEGQALLAALAAAEARIGRFVRFVKATDAWLAEESGDRATDDRLYDEIRAARAAITAQDVA